MTLLERARSALTRHRKSALCVPADVQGCEISEISEISRRTPPDAPAASTVASVPFMMTVEMTAQLRDLGYSEEAVDALRPAEAREVINAGRRAGQTAFTVITRPEDLAAVSCAIEESVMVGLDVETTGLCPRNDRVRLLTLATDRGVYVIDVFTADPAPLFDLLAEREVVGHNLAFDAGFLVRMGFVPGRLRDTMLLAQLLAAGTFDKCSLKDTCQRYLGRALDKVEQKSDWSGTLTPDQLQYAAEDAAVLPELHRVLMEKIAEAKLDKVAEIESRALPALVWMGQQGVPLGREAWRALAQAADDDADGVRAELDAAAPQRPGHLLAEAWNWDSPTQVGEALALLGCKVDGTSDEALAAAGHPLAELVRRYRLATKRGTTYGAEWLKHVADDGRVYARWMQLGAASGRMSCRYPNMQQLPRDEAYRRCVAAPPGRVLVKADYGQIQLRIATLITGDKGMLEAYQQGEDLHTRTARSVLGVEQVTKADRQLAKAVNFGLVFGMGARGFKVYAKSNYGLDLTDEQATAYREAFFKAYPDLRAWHERVSSSIRRATFDTWETRTRANRRRTYTRKRPKENQKVGQFPFTDIVNTPVQGTEADGLKTAMWLLWERRDEVPGAVPVLAVHDELVVECDEQQADAVAGWLKRAMVDGMAPLIAPVPVEVEVKVAKTWGGD